MIRWQQSRSFFPLLALLATGAFSFVALSDTPAPEKAEKKKGKAKATAKPAEPAAALSLDDAYRKARANGKYRMLLTQLKVEQDREEFGDFHESGLVGRPRYAGYTNLPGGYWVYVYPYWYIWRDLTAVPNEKEGWSADQAAGAPDTPASGDFPTAWASLSPDGQREWLILEYAEPMQPKAIRIHETWNPGAVNRISAFMLSGEEVTVWSGRDPTAVGSDRGVSVIPLKIGFKTSRVRISINSPDVEGWNEIDAVGLDDADGKTHWAAAAHASSTNAPPNRRELLNALIVTNRQIQILEQRVLQLQAMVLELRKNAKKDAAPAKEKD